MPFHTMKIEEVDLDKDGLGNFVLRGSVSPDGGINTIVLWDWKKELFRAYRKSDMDHLIEVLTSYRERLPD